MKYKEILKLRNINLIRSFLVFCLLIVLASATHFYISGDSINKAEYVSNTNILLRMILFSAVFFLYGVLACALAFGRNRPGFFGSNVLFIICSMSWLFSMLFLYASTYVQSGLVDRNGVIVKDRITALYFSIATWTTLGYGDFSPTESIRLMAGFQAIMGYLFMALMIGFLFQIMNSSNLNSVDKK